MAAEHAHESGLAGRYALAIFDLAQEERAVEAVAHDFATLKQLMSESPDSRASFVRRCFRAKNRRPV